MSMYEPHTEEFRAGYSDAYHGKDRRERYTGDKRREYLKGRKSFKSEQGFDVMQELNG